MRKSQLLKIFYSIADFQTTHETVVTIGTFDGVHLGHKKVLERLIKVSEEEEKKSVVLTFFPHPRTVLEKGDILKHLNTIEEKTELIAQVGIDFLIIHPFNESFSNLSAEQFVSDVLVNTLNCKKIIIGHDHRFGKGRSADFNDLVSFGKKHHFEVEQISVREIETIAVSSTKIRNALENGKIELANEYLGYPYFISGKIVKGKQIGRTIGFPTANLQIDQDYKLIPEIGVYIVQIILNNITYYGMMNIGQNPTLEHFTQNVKIEVHIFDFESDIYETYVKVSLLKKIREEKKFKNIEDLKAQLASDRDFSLEYIQSL